MMLAGRYRLVRRIATGGMGTVHEGVDERLGRRVAVKMLKEEYADDATFVERFAREARATATLKHPHIAQVFDFGQDADRHFIVMEFVEGEQLGDVLREAGRLTPERAVEVATQVCSALAVAHAAGIVHRDIKPGNVMVRPDGQVMVTDFGIAQTRGQTALTGTGSVLGTAQYLSPEQASGQGATPASDVYSVGVLCFQMLTGTVPFTDDSPVAVALSHIREEIPSVRDLVPEVPAALAAVVARATAKDPRGRYSDAGQMERALQESLAARREAPTAALSAATGTTGRPGGPSRRGGAVSRSWRLAAAGLLVAGLLAVGWMLLFDNESPEAASGPRAQPSIRPVQLSARPSPSERSTKPTPQRKKTSSGPVIPADAVGGNVKTLEAQLKARGFDVHKVDIESAAPKDSVVATIPSPGEPLSAGQSVVLIASKGQAPQDPKRHLVPGGIVGSDAKEAEQRVKDQDFEVKTVDVDSTAPKDTVIATYPAPGTYADTGTVVLVVSRGQ